MIVTAKDISRQLALRVDQFAPWLLPNGKKEGSEWCVGSTAGEKGFSTKVHLVGPKAGVWSDFAGTEKGDLLALICAVKGLRFREALKFAKEYLGIRGPESFVPGKSYAVPRESKYQQAEGEVLDYLTKVRKLSIETIRAYRVRHLKGQNGAEIVMPNYSPADDLVNIKYLSVKRDAKGKKISRQEAGCAPSLFGWQAIPEGVREVVITEGEIDAMTWAHMGFPALSVPMGAGNDGWIDYEWDNLEQFDSIYLSYDEDKEGRENCPKIAGRLGVHRCMIVRLGEHKDANEALQKGKGRDWFAHAITSAKPITPVHIKTPKQFRDRVQARFYPTNGVEPGLFPNIFGRELGMRPGELTIWTGISGHGKSVLLNQVTLAALLSGVRCAIASMEMRGEQTIGRMICQAENVPLPLPHVIDQVLDWLSGKLWIYDVMGHVTAKLIIELMEYSYSRHGVTFFVIDSLMKCAISEDDYEAQRAFLNDLSAFSKDRDAHVNLVAHGRKARDESESPGKMDVKGSSNIINQADNIMTVWRNKEKEEARRDKQLDPTDERVTPDAVARCLKQRESGLEFKTRLYYRPETFRFERMEKGFEDNLSVLERIKQETLGI